MRHFRLLLILSALLFACHNKPAKSSGVEEEGNNNSGEFNYEAFSKKFSSLKTPYQLTDSALLQNEDTTSIKASDIKPFIADSITNKIFGKTAKPKYIALGKIHVPKEETYYVVKATAGSRKAALLITFNKENQFSATFPFLAVDDDPATTQTSAIDKAYTISRSVSRKGKNDIVKEGRDVYVYNNDAKQFTLIMTDLLDESNAELVNPIDTFPRQNKLTGDYIKDKKNMVSVRDGRRPNELRVFVHFEKDKGACTGELRGDALIITGNRAVYRQGGDPCVLEFSFTPTAVTIREQEGCGSHRGVQCLFEGTYPRKKEPKTNTTTKKSSSKKR